MTPTDTVTVADYVDRFLREPATALGALGRVARAVAAGSLAHVPEEFGRLVEEAALSLEPHTAPILVSAPSHERARAAVEPILALAAGGDDVPLFTYAWRTGDDRPFSCPYRHDPILLIPEKSRQEVLTEAMRSGTIAYPLASESRSHCPWCQRRYAEALARAGGVWQELASEILVHEKGAGRAGGACPAAQIMAANRGALFLPLEDAADLPEVLRIMRGGGPWPPVVGLLFIPVTEDEEHVWRELPEIAGALDACWYRLDAP